MESGFQYCICRSIALVVLLGVHDLFLVYRLRPLALDAVTEGKWSHKSWNRLPVHARPRYKRYSASTLSTSMCTQSPR
jgi:hypothetical protein